MDEREPSIQNRTAQSVLDTRARAREINECGQFVTRWTLHRGPRRSHTRARVRQQRLADSELAGRVAGEGGDGGASTGLKWNPTAIAHLEGAGISPEEGYSGGATARGGGATTGNMATGLRLRPRLSSARQGYTRVQGTHRDDPKAGRWPEEGR